MKMSEQYMYDHWSIKNSITIKNTKGSKITKILAAFMFHLK